MHSSLLLAPLWYVVLPPAHDIQLSLASESWYSPKPHGSHCIVAMFLNQPGPQGAVIQ